jgi:hypothetical protein
VGVFGHEGFEATDDEGGGIGEEVFCCHCLLVFLFLWWCCGFASVWRVHSCHERKGERVEE